MATKNKRATKTNEVDTDRLLPRTWIGKIIVFLVIWPAGNAIWDAYKFGFDQIPSHVSTYLKQLSAGPILLSGFALSPLLMAWAVESGQHLFSRHARPNLIALIHASAVMFIVYEPWSIKLAPLDSISLIFAGFTLLCVTLLVAFHRRLRPKFILISKYENIIALQKEIVNGAREVIVTTGGFARDKSYLSAIENCIAKRPTLKHYRVLQKVRREELRLHLKRLLVIRPPADHVNSIQTNFIGALPDAGAEQFVVANERVVFISLPVAGMYKNYDVGLRIDDPEFALSVINCVHQMYVASESIGTEAELVSHCDPAKCGKNEK